MSQTKELKFYRNPELRARIVREVGLDPGDRFQRDGHVGILQSQWVEVVLALTDRSREEVEQLALVDLYEIACEAAGGEYREHAGNPWGVTRENLKHILRTLEGQR